LPLYRFQTFGELLHRPLQILRTGGGRARIETLGNTLPAAPSDLRQAALFVKAGIEQIVEGQVRLLSGLLGMIVRGPLTRLCAP
jgi:hypothetical protein